ncbi:2986_t:CDS:1, partial [Racocetra persica]
KKAEELFRASQQKNTKTRIIFTSPKIREILTETYEHIIFEEQISQILALVYDCSFAEAEVKRRELPEKGLQKDFLAQAQKKMSLTE